MVLIVIRGGDDRRRRLTQSATMLEAGMADHTRDLVVDLMCEQQRRGDRDQKVREEPVGLQETIIEEGVAVIGPDGRRGAEVVPAVHAAEERLPVDEAVEPVEPGIEDYHRGGERRHRVKNGRLAWPKADAEHDVRPPSE